MGKDLTVAVRDFIALDNHVNEYQKHGLAPSTRRVYDECWQQFVNFLVPLDAWRAQPMDVARWLAEQALRGVNPLTIEHRCGALTYYYEKLGKGAARGRYGVGIRESPVRDLIVQQTLKGIFRKHGRPPDRKQPLMLDTLGQMIDYQPTNLFGLRNRVMLIVGWGAALRVSEITMLDATPRGGGGNGWVDISDEGLVVHLRRSKRNQNSRRLEHFAIPARRNAPHHCPVQLLRAWLRESGIKKGPLFPCVGRRSKKPGRERLSHRCVRHMLKATVKKFGIDPKQISGHSLRSGCLSWLDQQHVPVHQIRAQAGHKNVQSVLPYLRGPIRIEDSALAETKWVG